MKRREIEPAIYNPRRLFEQPIPSLNVETDSTSDFNPDVDDEMFDADHDEAVMEFKAEPESVIELAEEDIDGLYDLINENEEITNSDDEIEMTVDGVFSMPTQVSSHDLVKRQDDWLTGNLPFNDTVSIIFIVY